MNNKNLFQSVSTNLLQELKAFGDIASQQYAQLEVSQTSAALTYVALPCVAFYLNESCFFMSVILQTGIQNITDRPGQSMGTHSAGEGELFQRSH